MNLLYFLKVKQVLIFSPSNVYHQFNFYLTYKHFQTNTKNKLKPLDNFKRNKTVINYKL